MKRQVAVVQIFLPRALNKAVNAAYLGVKNMITTGRVFCLQHKELLYALPQRLSIPHDRPIYAQGKNNATSPYSHHPSADFILTTATKI